jgi:hypothetical protein
MKLGLHTFAMVNQNVRKTKRELPKILLELLSQP